MTRNAKTREAAVILRLLGTGLPCKTVAWAIEVSVWRVYRVREKAKWKVPKKQVAV